jgi:hypothetical protein
MKTITELMPWRLQQLGLDPGVREGVLHIRLPNLGHGVRGLQVSAALCARPCEMRR